MDGGQFFGPLMEDFYAESEEHVAGVRRALLELEEGDPASPLAAERVRSIFRSLHTLKGLSGMVGFAETERLAHAMEDWLRGVAPSGTPAAGIPLAVLFDGIGLLERSLLARRNGAAPPDVDAFTARLGAPAAPGPAAPAEPAPSAAKPALPEGLALSPAEAYRLDAAVREGAPVYEFEFTPTPERVARGVGVEAVRGRLSGIGEIVHAAPRVLPGRGVAFRFLVALTRGEEPPEAWREDGMEWSPLPPEAVAEQPAASPEPAGDGGDGGAGEQPRGATLTSGSVVRVDLARLDELMRLVGELVISRARLDDAVGHAERGGGVPVDVLDEINTAMERQLRDLREGVMRVRLVPIGEVFERMRFVVRDVARESAKQVRVELRGQATEIDKLVVERMMEPLLHLVRNAVSHGLETPEERRAAGKPEEGRLLLEAYTAGERVQMVVEDDGRGIDRAAVAARARSRGLALPADAGLDDAALLDVLCAPGFSTRDEADLSSGRGVGMEVVRSTVRALGGNLFVSSHPGRGTRFTVELPLTLMIVDALLVRIGEQTMAVPQPALLEVVQVEPHQVVPFENNEVVRYRDRVLPLLRLRRLFGIGGDGEPRSFPVLVVGAEAQPIGLAVDRITGLREIVVRSLADPLVAVPGVAGAAELGDGRVCLILDSAELAQLAHRQREGARAVPAAVVP